MSSADNATQKTIVLISSDGKAFEVEAAVALQSETIKNVLDNDFAAGTTLPVPEVSSNILAKVIEYCKHHTEAAAEKDAREFDTAFVEVDQTTLFDLVLAANFLNIRSLIYLTCQTVADMLKVKTPEELRKAFNIPSEFSAEEEEEVRGKNA